MGETVRDDCVPAHNPEVVDTVRRAQSVGVIDSQDPVAGEGVLTNWRACSIAPMPRGRREAVGDVMVSGGYRRAASGTDPGCVQAAAGRERVPPGRIDTTRRGRAARPPPARPLRPGPTLRTLVSPGAPADRAPTQRTADDSGDDNADDNPAPAAQCRGPGRDADRRLGAGLRASGGQGVAGSNPVAPTVRNARSAVCTIGLLVSFGPVSASTAATYCSGPQPSRPPEPLQCFPDRP